MDEVDIDSVEDLNELEARLYSQIHHEAVNEHIDPEGNTSITDRQQERESHEQDQPTLPNNPESDCKVSTRNRYWKSNANTKDVPAKQQPRKQHSKQLPQKAMQLRNDKRSTSDAAVGKGSQSGKEAPKDACEESNANTHTSPTSRHVRKGALKPKQANSRRPNPNARKQREQGTQMKQGNVHLKLDHVTRSSTRNQSKKEAKTSNKEASARQMKAKNGPFAKRVEKLQKAIRMETKRQKSKKVRAVCKKPEPNTVVELSSSDESESSDVVEVPTLSPPTFTVDDSDDDDEMNKSAESIEVQNMATPEQIGCEENAVDASDVKMTTSACFIRPQQMAQTVAPNEHREKRVENSSCCTSPGSMFSSDDFIVQNDRRRLLNGSGVADDEDLVLLTANMDSLMEAQPKEKYIAKQSNDVRVLQDVEPEADDSHTEHPAQFAIPPAGEPVQKGDYRVSQTQFRALDVYDSESDMTEGVYSKGARKATIIREIVSSSDSVNSIDCSEKTKRLRKRRASGSNKESETNNDELSSSEEELREHDENSGVHRKALPYIAPGPAVERFKRKLSRNASSGGSSFRRAGSRNVSDGKFLAALNTMAQGGDDNEEDEGDESDVENVPTARDIAEEILAKKTGTCNSNNDVAVPDHIFNELGKVFETIDKLDKHKSSGSSSVDVGNAATAEIISDDEVEITMLHEEPVPRGNLKESTFSNKGSPEYNVIYSGDYHLEGGIGWNDEMRKFYNDSWKGENFIIKKIFQRMNPNKSLWRIHNEDRFSKPMRRVKNLKCNNCYEFGHTRARCKRPKKPLICYMCGLSGHTEPRCPNTICLRCGRKTRVFLKSCKSCSFQNSVTCPLCNVRGHSLDFCPDKWRRYHSTTQLNVYLDDKVEYNPRKCCCICGGRGHLAENCASAVRFMEYPITVSTIKSHMKAYSDMPMKSSDKGIGFNLLYKPCREISFKLADQTTAQKYYGRFLVAVGMGHLLKSKRRLRAPRADIPAKKAKDICEESVPIPDVEVAQQLRVDDAPNQVQEVSESGNVDMESVAENVEVTDNTGVSDETELAKGDVELIESSVEGQTSEENQLNQVEDEPRNVTSEKEDHNLESENEAAPEVQPENSAQATPLSVDSDSNYSFSEHFDVPSTSVAGDGAAAQEESSHTSNCVDSSTTEPSSLVPEKITKRPELKPMPDFIPLVETSSNTANGENNEVVEEFVVTNSDDDDQDDQDDQDDGDDGAHIPLSHLPCEAKIYLTQFHSKYLLSPEGHAFLEKTSKECDLKARIDWTSVGHVLIIYGLQKNQDQFHRQLLVKYNELSEQIQQKQSIQNVPKRADVLIRFLRGNINQLLKNLGNVNELLRRMQRLEKQHSKSGFKLAEKVRRSLNMILVGQAGLQDGNHHLDKLLLSLKTLIYDYGAADVASHELRNEITAHWKVIFTPYRHKNYQELVQTYNKLMLKNRVRSLSIDPILLGKKVANRTLSAEGRVSLEPPRSQVSPDSDEKYTHIVPNPLNPRNAKLLKRKRSNSTGNVISPLPSESKLSGEPAAHTATAVAPTMLTAEVATPNAGPNKSQASAGDSLTKVPLAVHSSKKQDQAVCLNASKSCEKRSNVPNTIGDASEKGEKPCGTQLSKTDVNSSNGKGAGADAKMPSAFWSRESLSYLEECVKMAALKQSLMEKLQRVKEKSQLGQLSYNDYLAVIKLHTALCGRK